MDRLTRADVDALCRDPKGPAVSLYMPTHPGGSQDDRLRFRKLLDVAAEGLAAAGLHGSRSKEFLHPLHALLGDDAFWGRTSTGLAAFLAENFVRTYRLRGEFAEGVDVGGPFRVIPLLSLVQGDGEFYVLALSQNGVRLWKGTQDEFDAVDIPNVPQNMEAALRTHDRDEVLTAHSRVTSGGRWGAIYEGHGVGIDDAKDDLKRYFQAIDRGLRTTLRDERAPMVLACVEYLAPIYRDVNSYAHLLPEVIHGNPDRVSSQDLHCKAWSAVAPMFRREVGQATELYRRAAAHGRATADADAIVGEAYRGKVETLFVAKDARLSGTVDAQTGKVTRYERPSPGATDMINLAAVHTLRHGNRVYVLPSQEMPACGPIAAIAHLPIPKHGKEH